MKLETGGGSATLVNQTTLLARLTAARAGYLDELAAANLPADVDTLKQRSVTVVSMKPSPSLIDPLITLTTATANVVLPNIVVANLPANITVIDTVANLTPRALNNTNAATNAINGAGAVNIKAAAGAWGVDDVALITISDNILSTAASTKEGGRPILGSHNASSVVTGNGTYNLRFDGNIFVDGNNLELIDVDVVLEVYFIPS